MEATEDTAGEVVVAWTAPSGTDEVNGYRVMQRKVGLNHPVTTFQAGVTATSYTDDTVDPETMYDYWVVAWNDTGDSPNSRKEFITTQVQTAGVPNAPSRPTLTEETRGEVVVTWTADISGPDPSGYKVYRKKVGIGDYNLLTTASALSHTDDTVEAETWYGYRVRAINDAGDGDESGTDWIKTGVQTEEAPGTPEDTGTDQ